MDPVLLANLCATWTMVGVIWFTQGAHYPLFARVGRAEFARYAADNVRLTAFVVVPAMLVEAVTSLALAISPRGNLSPPLAWAGLVLVGIAWASTLLVQWPRHRRFAREGFDERGLRHLLATNLVRVSCWTARAALTVYAVS